ncbi:unnamed protein product [Pleuronectes platessa]|uniref:Uncharacterized protein n=1 Tax=Pleuronectes platessa TaxID=8262 RepID=A0A9N7UA11_PLEPL|nr:unnamed protein product [Pleuronectes platessa]
MIHCGEREKPEEKPVGSGDESRGTIFHSRQKHLLGYQFGAEKQSSPPAPSSIIFFASRGDPTLWLPPYWHLCLHPITHLPAIIHHPSRSIGGHAFISPWVLMGKRRASPREQSKKSCRLGDMSRGHTTTTTTTTNHLKSSSPQVPSGPMCQMSLSGYEPRVSICRMLSLGYSGEAKRSL